MRPTGLFWTWALLSLYTVPAFANPTCNTAVLPDWAVDDFHGLHHEFNSSVTDLCETYVAHSEPINHSTGNIVLKVDGKADSDSYEACLTAFSALVTYCVGNEKVNGGVIVGADGAIFEAYHDGFYHDESLSIRSLPESIQGNDLEARSPRGGRRTSKDRQRRPRPMR
ncbi:hypothetical protein BU23DRAFT_569716 [Bimuria novae-zelandiae CBS 107.79]|uniref:Ecp2 effector protein domain-containing protein n=1 Tax=Bimuria novae-zelandiae CBS 107.79 TaxID=1447943 RepID=A0A6A5V3X0_9PLEO|nr:hypothetical protein BU23DRAFT_569716 [Bimuria novae-zelandiae CBS 107.79]